MEWRIIERLEERLDLVWPYAAIPFGIFAALLWERIAGTYTGSDLFWRVSVLVTGGFGLAVGGARLTVDQP